MSDNPSEKLLAGDSHGKYFEKPKVSMWEKLKNICKKKKLPPRKMYMNPQGPEQVSHNNSAGFASNSISTTKYKWWNFVVLNIFEQFYYRIANVYFLLIAILQIIPRLSPVGSFNTSLQLGAVVLVRMCIDLVEDLIQSYSDFGINNHGVIRCQDDVWVKSKWSRIHTGDIVRVHNNEAFPCDLLMVDSSDPTGSCFIETAMLDGEIDLKYRRAPEATWKLWLDSKPEEKQHGKLNAFLEYDQPNVDLYSFNGNMTLKGEDESIPISKESILLRGSKLKNTDWIVGIAIYTGHDTKIMRNRNNAPFKRSQLDVLTNRDVLLCFCIQVILCLFSVTAMTIFNATNVERWYIAQKVDAKNLTEGWFRNFWSFVILYANLIPISLFISMESSKVFQGYFIAKDLAMYYEDPKGPPIPAVVRTSKLNEDLGQVSFIFSDKTGTLTANEMKLFKCSIDGIPYGKGVTEIKRSANSRNGIETFDERPPEFQGNAPLQFYDPQWNFKPGDWTRHQNSAQFTEFLRMLAVCHTVIVEKNPVTGENVLSAASPDENALVHGAKLMGVEFFHRDLTTIKIRVNGVDETYELLDTVEFNSDRKRMSVIVRNEQGQVVIYCKGADSILWPLVKDCPKDLYDATYQNLQTFAEEGLRTLLCCKAVIPEEKWKKLSAELTEARRILISRDKQIAEAKVVVEMEKDFVLVGATALEDKLQVGVPLTISELKKAKIRIWVLTGDKLDTAENIGHACDLLNNQMHKYRIQDTDVEADDAGVRAHKLGGILKNYLIDSQGRKNQGMLIEGKTALATVFDDPQLQDLFVKLAIRCDAVVCCRVSPKQKADVVDLVQSKLQKGYVTLSIGDGGNDVPMIQTARVGVGIAGKEGMQAANAADYSFGQFRFLKRLLLVHGRWSYRRISKLILYAFYKNIVLYLTQFFFVFWNGFTGTSIHDRWQIAFFNIWFTAHPIIVLAVFDRDLKADVAEDYPQLYKQGHKRRFFTFSIFVGYIANSIFHSFLCFIIPLMAMRDPNLGFDGGMLSLGMTIYTCVMFVVTIKLALETGSWTIANLFALTFSLGSWYAFVGIYANMFRFMGFNFSEFLGKEWYGCLEMYKIMGTSLFWFTVLLTCVVCILRDVTWKAWRRMASLEIYYAAMAKGKNVSKEAFEAGFPIEEGLPIRLKGKSTVKSLFSATVEKELGGFLSEKTLKMIVQEMPQEAYTGYAFTGDETGDMMRKRSVATEHLALIKKSRK